MRVLYLCTSIMNEILKPDSALTELGHTYSWFNTDQFYLQISYVQKKLYKFGFKSLYTNWRKTRLTTLFKQLSDFAPEKVLFINFPDYIFQPDELKEITDIYSTNIWFVDACSPFPSLNSYYKYFRKIFVFEPLDIPYLRNLCSKEAYYLPDGYNKEFEFKGINPHPLYDVSFVGYPYLNRLALFDELSELALKNNWQLAFFGPFWEEKYIWKKHFFKIKHPNLSKFVFNGRITPKKAAEIYRNSRICLNIHKENHKGLNNRTFEILATGSFQIMDVRSDYAGLITPGKDLAIYHSAEELKNLIHYYLDHEDERLAIAKNGCKAVTQKLSMATCIAKALL